MNKELYVSTTPHETKLALVEDDSLAEVYFERANEYTLAGSIYKGRVTRVLPGMQSAFVEIGLERDAFLYVSDFLELQEEDEEGEYGEVKVSGAVLAQANGMILAEPPAEEEDSEKAPQPASAVEAEAEKGEEGSGAPRWRGRRRRRGRRGGRERSTGERTAEAQPAAPGSEDWANQAEESVEAAAEAAPRESKRRELRGFEPRGLVVHGLSRAADADAVEPESEIEEPEAGEEATSAAPASYAPVVLPGESISKYNRAEGEAPATAQPAAAEESERGGYSRGRGRDRGGRGRRGERDRGRGREREREPRQEESFALPKNYTPIVLPGESISKYRGSEAAAAPAKAESRESTAAEERGSVRPPKEESGEPLSSASYSGASKLPSLTQRYAPEPAEAPGKDEESVQEEAEEIVERAEEAAEEAISSELAAEEQREEELRAEAPEAEEAAEEVSAAGAAPIEAEEESAAQEAEFAHEEGRPGSFVIEGGQVEHEELDEEEAEMPALAEHFDRYEEDETEREDEDNGSQFGDAVREAEEESELEDDEYDFGGEEFEESEMLAGAAVEEEEEEGEEESDEPLFAAPEPGAQRPERVERRDRRGRRGAPPQRGGGGMRARTQSRAVPLISELLKEGQEILVQIAKEPIGKKGARITSHIALPGRFLVYMPTVNHIGVSRKISSEEERQRLKRIVSSERENGHGGFIVRTAASNIKEDELRADIRFLKHLWTEIRSRAEKSKSPALIYHDLNLVERILRDQVTSDFSQIWVDNENEYERVVRFASRFQPSLVRRIKLYTKDAPLFDQFGINEEINKSLKSKVWLKSGGYIVINQTEALVAIDINTGKYVGKTARLEDTIVKTNIDAVKEIVRQIRLRDLGGIIVIDFIDMDERKNRQKVMQALEEAMKSDRAPSKALQFNDFGLVAITRKRVKQSLERTLGTPCPYCDATGFVKSVQTVCNEIYVEMRKIRRHVQSKEVVLRVNTEVAKELKGGNGRWLQEMEELLGRPVLVKSDPLLHQEKFDMNY
jgi:Rne/Rng family ribonuclease